MKNPSLANRQDSYKAAASADSLVMRPHRETSACCLPSAGYIVEAGGATVTVVTEIDGMFRMAEWLTPY